jgi:hypothetical protein
MHECNSGEYWFYHKDSYPLGNPCLLQELINAASSEITIWDPYFNVTNVAGVKNDSSIFMNLKDNITIKILTHKGLDKNKKYLQDVRDSLKMIIPITKNCRFGLRVINRGDEAHDGGRFFHDRYLFIDRVDVYLMGSSVGFYVSPNDSTGMLKVTNETTKEFIGSIFQHYWDNSTAHQIPVMYLWT